MSLRFGLRAQEQPGVRVDQRRVLGLDVHPDDGVAVLDADRVDLADLDPGDHHGLPLARGHGLGRGELAAEVVEALAEEGDPARQRRLLLGEDPEGHREPRDHQHADGEEVAEATAELAPQHRAPMRTVVRGRALIAVAAPRGRARGADGAEARVEVGDVVRITLDVGPVRGLRAEARLGPERRQRRVGPQRLVRGEVAVGIGLARGQVARLRAAAAGRRRCRRSSGSRPPGSPSCRRTRGSSAGRSRSGRRSPGCRSAPAPSSCSG